MPVSFRLEKDEGRLDWSHQGEGATSLDDEQAMIVAVAEIGEALREIALAFRQFNETSAKNAQIVASAAQNRASNA